MDKYIGKLLDGRYEVLEVIGVGGMSLVYKARCRVLNRFVAIKILKDEYARDEEFRRRFYIESQAVAKLSHNNIVSVYDVSHTEGLDYIVMELIEGVTLKDYLQGKGHLSWQEALFFAQQIAHALEHAHSRGIIHQDIKPQNIMILQDGTAKVTDFGIASFAATQDTRVVQEAIGSVHYISPEQAKGSRIDYRTDIYSLGVVMYEMLTGKLPFEGDTPLAIVMQHINAVPMMPSEVIQGIPRGMDQIVMRAMCPNVMQRYASANEVSQALTTLQNDPQTRFAYGNPANMRGNAPSMDRTQPLPSYDSLKKEQQQVRPAKQDAYAKKPHRKKGFFERISESPASIAALAVGGFAILAVIIACALVFGGGAGNKVVVPSFINQNIQTILDDTSLQERFTIIIGEKIEDDTLDEGTIVKQSIEKGTHVKSGAAITLDVSTKPVEDVTENYYTIESFAGKQQAEAESILTAAGILYSVQEETSEEIIKGRVTRTMPAEGTRIDKKTAMILYVSSGKESESTAKMPNVLGMQAKEAQKILEAYGLVVEKFRTVASDQPENEVVTQSIPADTEVKQGDGVILEISSGFLPSDPENQPPDEPASSEGSPSDTQVPPDTQDTPDTTLTGTTQISIAIPPEFMASAHIVIQLDTGEVVYDQTFTNAQSMETVTIKGSGTHVASIYVNDELLTERSVTFD